MPAAYAHHTFGEACIERMPEKLKTICTRYRGLFDIGVHGPDILFYYKPLSSNAVSQHGSELHRWTGAQFFEICKYVYHGMPRSTWKISVNDSSENDSDTGTEKGVENPEELPASEQSAIENETSAQQPVAEKVFSAQQPAAEKVFSAQQPVTEKQITLTPAEKNAMLAYLMGFLAHFTLDSCCHGYVNAMAEESDLSHNRIESQYEVFLMKRNGLDPMKVDRSLSLKPTKENAAVIAKFFPFSEAEIQESVKGQKKVLHLFYSPAEAKKKLVRKLIKRFGVNGDFGDLFLDTELVSGSEEFNGEILKRQNMALKLYPGLLQNLIRYLYDKTVLDEYFRYDFEGDLHS